MLLVTSGFAAIVKDITSLNGAWDPEATWRFNHSIFGREGEKPNETVGAGTERKSLQSVYDRDLLGTNRLGAKWLKKFYPTIWDSQTVQTDLGIEGEHNGIVV
ncbi:unnamed protein product [Prunus armeniaca]